MCECATRQFLTQKGHNPVCETATGRGAVRGRRDSWRPGHRRGRPSATKTRGWEGRACDVSAPGGANLAKSGAQRGGHQPPRFSFFLRPFSALQAAAAARKSHHVSRAAVPLVSCSGGPRLGLGYLAWCGPCGR